MSASFPVARPRRLRRTPALRALVAETSLRPRELVLPVFVCVIFFIALLVGYPWYILSAGTVLYLLSLPLGWKSYRDHVRAAELAGTPAAEVAPPASASPFTPVADSSQDDRPERLH